MEKAKVVIVEITPGAGGEESQAFARMLAGAYKKRAARQGWTFAEIPCPDGIQCLAFKAEDGSHKSLLAEGGVHRLVRISPFDKQHRRHTSFATVEVREPSAINMPIRSYVFDPYRMVQDHREGWESEGVEGFFEGRLPETLRRR